MRISAHLMVEMESVPVLASMKASLAMAASIRICTQRVARISSSQTPIPNLSKGCFWVGMVCEWMDMIWRSLALVAFEATIGNSWRLRSIWTLMTAGGEEVCQKSRSPIRPRCLPPSDRAHLPHRRRSFFSRENKRWRQMSLGCPLWKMELHLIPHPLHLKMKRILHPNNSCLSEIAFKVETKEQAFWCSISDQFELSQRLVSIKQFETRKRIFQLIYTYYLSLYIL